MCVCFKGAPASVLRLHSCHAANFKTLKGIFALLVSHPLNEPFHPRSATNTGNVNKDNHFDVSKDKSKAFIIAPMLL